MHTNQVKFGIDTKYLLELIPKCFTYVNRDVRRLGELRGSKAINSPEKFFSSLKSKTQQEFNRHFGADCPVFFEELPQEPTKEYIAVSLSDFNNAAHGMSQFGAVILYRNEEYRVSIMHHAESGEMIVLKQERFFKRNIEGAMLSLKPFPKTDKIITADYMSEDLLILADKFGFDKDNIRVIGSAIYPIMMALEGKIDMVYLKVRNPIIAELLGHIAYNLEHQGTAPSLVGSNQRKYVLKLHADKYLLDLSKR